MTTTTATKLRKKQPSMTSHQLNELCLELCRLQGQRVICIKSRIMQMNRLRAVVAGNVFHYSTRMEDSDRKQMFKKALDHIKSVEKGEVESPLEAVIKASLAGPSALEEIQEGLEKEMLKIVKQLPIKAWMENIEQRGFGWIQLATIVGETGNLLNFSNPAKLWKYMGLMPYTYDGKTRMGATWRSGKEGKLPAEEWERFKYNPRRRSLSYLIGESLMKLNTGDEGEIDEDGTVVTAARDAGPYRLRYDEAKARAEANHPEWVACVCKGSGVGKKGGKCSECMGKGKKMKRCHLHGMLCAAKMLLKNLWIEWHNTKLEGS